MNAADQRQASIEPGPAVPVVVRPGAADRRHPRCRAAPRGRPSGARSWPDGRTTGTAPRIRAEPYLIITPDEMPAAWCLADPKTGEREVADELLAHARRVRAPRPGLTLIGDKGFAGQESEDLATAGSGLRPARPGRRGQAPRHGSAGWIRQAIESVNDTLKGQLDLERHGGRTCWPWPGASGTTGPAARRSPARLSHTTTEPIRNHSSRQAPLIPPGCPLTWSFAHPMRSLSELSQGPRSHDRPTAAAAPRSWSATPRTRRGQPAR